MAQANRYFGRFCSSPSIFPPHIIQVLLGVGHPALMSCTEAGFFHASAFTCASTSPSDRPQDTGQIDHIVEAWPGRPGGTDLLMAFWPLLPLSTPPAGGALWTRLWHASGLARPLLLMQEKDARWQGKDNNALEPHPLGCGIVVQEIAYATLV